MHKCLYLLLRNLSPDFNLISFEELVVNPNTFFCERLRPLASLLVSAALLVIVFVVVPANQSKRSRGRIGLGTGHAAKAQGELEVVFEDSHPRSRLLYFLNTQDSKLALHFRGDPPAGLQTGMHLAVEGFQVGDTLELNAGEVAPVTGVPLVAGVSTGQHRVLVILVNFQDKQTQPFTKDQAQSVMFGTTSDFFREASYGQTWLTGDVFGWYTIPVNSTVCDTTAISTYAQQAADDAGANLASYDHYVYAFPQNACTWQGRGSVGGTPSQAWINDWFELGIVAHELGHNFGLYHSRSMDCGAVSIGTGCTTDEYGDTLDIMGAANSAHFNLYQKDRLGWVNSGSNAPITTVTSSGNYWVDAYETGNMLSKGLKILKSTDPVTGFRTWYYVEHRSPIGFDNFLNGNTNVLNGVVVRTGSEASPQDTYLLDMTPATSSWYDPALTVGQSFTDSAAGFTITTVSADSSGAWVNVSVAAAPCTRANPTLTLSPAQNPWVSSGASVSYNVSVRNNDGATCGGSSFNLQSVVPNGWSASFGSSPLTIGPGSTSTTTLQVTSPSGAADGFYPVNVSTSNGSSSASSGVTYALVSALGFTTSASQSSYTRQQTVTVNATVKVAGSTVAGVPVTFTMTKSNGVAVTSTVNTGANGVAVFKYALNRKKDPTGSYQVRSQASMNGVSGSGNVNFVVK